MDTGKICMFFKIKRIFKINLSLFQTESAFKSRVRTGIIANRGNVKDPNEFLEKAFQIFDDQVKLALKKEKSALKINVILVGEFYMVHDPEIEDTKYFSTPNFEIFKSTNIKKTFKKIFEQILTDVSIIYLIIYLLFQQF